MSILTLTNIGFSYNKEPFLDNVSFHLARGEVLGILGRNGAGKTTLFDLICALRKPCRGEINNASHRQVYLTQVLTPPPSLRMSEAAGLVAQLNAPRVPGHAELVSRLSGWSLSLGRRYAEISQKKVSTCSYGEIRSYFTLTLLLLDSDLIILDEPTAGVDPEFRHYIWLGISSACKEGASVLVSSHYTQEIVAHCNRFYMLAQGQLEAFESGNQFLTRYQATSLDDAFINAAL
ncbi:ATP-binding cassette domain-containing protein [Pseudomonas sp. Leaf58]|uniref:ATP-binding cassette domain-containing protein n=1 Tax=Pseudomonas TaxID=286 RepID=UPI0006FE95B8|nr:ATP-binding cassette domain-containing protein [Pseudomonas sp. Leaf58]AYG45537.1 ATP-binding cassette domain-containing protein [Pseudomonas sp. Leaf58]KQN58748.1 ABC transporter [Pseudomonas sp. Leaf58]